MPSWVIGEDTSSICLEGWGTKTHGGVFLGVIVDCLGELKRRGLRGNERIGLGGFDSVRNINWI